VLLHESGYRKKFLDRAGGLENPVDSSKRTRWRSHENEGNQHWSIHQKMRGRSARHRGKKGRSRLLDELVEVTRGERQNASRALLGKRLRKRRGGKRGAPTCEGGDLIEVLKSGWLAMAQVFAKRMKDPWSF
jgi:hypothetical protein